MYTYLKIVPDNLKACLRFAQQSNKKFYKLSWIIGTEVLLLGTG